MVDENQTVPVRRVLVQSSSGLVIVARLLVSSPVHAEDQLPHESDRAMPSVIRVGVPVPSPGMVAFAGSAGYGFIDRSLELEDPGSRLRGSVGAAFSPAPFLVAGVDARGHFDTFSSTDDDQANLYGEPRLTARFQMPASESLRWGVQLDARFVGAEAPDIELGATSPSVRGLLGARLAERTWLATELGFHLDNSDKALPDPELISSADRLTVGASSSPGVPWGIGVSHRLDLGLELLGELRGEVLVGGDAPGFLESPIGLGLGARHPITPNLDAMLSTDVSLSARPNFDSGAYDPIEPRAGVLVTAIWRFGVKEEPASEKPIEPAPVEKKIEEVPKEPEIPVSPVKGTVIDEGGRPLSDVVVILQQAGGESAEERTYADGTFEFKEVPEGPVDIVIKTPGYDEVKFSFAEGQERKREVVLYPSLPAGQVKGEVRDLKGNPLQAKISITPGDEVIEVGEDGTFELELKPGRYTLRFEHPDLSPQKRFIRVQDRGVVILNIALAP